MSIASISVETIVREHPELELKLISGEKGISKKIEFKYLEKGSGLI